MKLSFTSLIATTLAASAIATDPSRQLNLHAPNRQQTEAPVEHFKTFHQPPSLHAPPPQGASYLHQANRQQASALAASAMAGDPSRRLPIPQAEAPSPHLEHFKAFHEPLRAHRYQGGPLQLQAPPQRPYQGANLRPAETRQPHTTSHLHHEANRQPVGTHQYDPPYPQARQPVGRFEAEHLPASHQAEHDLHHEANRQPVWTWHQYNPQARQPVGRFEAEHQAEVLHDHALENINTAIKTTEQAMKIVRDKRMKKTQTTRNKWLLQRQRVHSSEEWRTMTTAELVADGSTAQNHTDDAQRIVNRHQTRT